MSAKKPKDADATPTPQEGVATEVEERDERTSFTFRYALASRVTGSGGKTLVELVGNGQRAAVGAEGKIEDPMCLREALSALYDVVKSDFRYVPKDRTAYVAYQRMRKQSSSMGSWEAQQAYIGWLARNDPMAWMILDPIVSVHPDELLFEVFSKDEGSYAKLGIDWSAFALDGAPVHGTTNIDYTSALFDGVQRMRSYRETRFTIGGGAVEVQTEGSAPVLEKQVKVPDAWLRGFLQVQSAGTLSATTVSIAPMDLYNVLRHLRLHADRKREGRAMRFELVPGEAPRIVLEPWGTVLNTTAGVYQGRTAQVIRVWGRRRLMLLRRLLPFLDRVDIHLLGTGLPSFYVLRAGPVTFTLGLSGFTSSNWAQAVSFDLLLPRAGATSETANVDRVVAYLADKYVATAKEIASGVDLKAKEALQALQLACQQGKLMYDIARDAYRYRPIAEETLDADRFAFRNQRERRAYDLLAEKGAVKIALENRVHGVGLEITGKVAVASEKREYRPQMLFDDEGRVRKAECTCTFFRKHQLNEGPCEHLVALRMAQAQVEAKRKEQRGKARDTITVETRTYTRRDTQGEHVFQLMLEQRRLKIRWGRGPDKPRVQNLVFDSVAEARSAYFAHVDSLEHRGFLDATAS